jgi:hypothetical protein
MMKLTTLTCCLAIAGAATLQAQSSETTTKTKIDVKDGKDMKVTGCVEAGADGGFVLTNVADKSGALHRYMLVSDSDDFSKVVGHRVQIEGKAGDRNHGKVEIKTETKATVRVIPMGEVTEAPCVVTGEKGRLVYFAQAY